METAAHNTRRVVSESLAVLRATVHGLAGARKPRLRDATFIPVRDTSGARR